MALEIIRPGQLTTVQDLGRPGWRRYGVVVGGAMDPVSLRSANLLVGNDPGAAGLEMTLVGPRIRFDADTVFAVCGGDFVPQVEGVTIPSRRPVWIRAGGELQFEAAVVGCRAYLALTGGLDVPVVLGGRGTCLRTGIGGWGGRSLRASDRLSALPRATPIPLDRELADQAGSRPVTWTTWSAGRAVDDQEVNTIRVLPGRQWAAFSQTDREAFRATAFAVTAQSDRMGYRLAGPSLGSLADHTFLSEAMVPGAIQVPPAGNPIVLMADGPVTGGYPVIGQVIAVDLPLLAQLRVDARIQFQQVTLSDARLLYLEREAEWSRLRAAVALRAKSAGGC